MKFKSIGDIKLFLLELGKVDLLGEVKEDFQPPEELVELFLKRRRQLIQRLKDFRRSQIQKANWRKYRYKYLKGIRKFHRSTKGKRFHRALGKFLATRIFRSEESLNTFEVAEALKALTSAKTHAYIELEYYCPIIEELDYLFFVEELVGVASRVERYLINEALLRKDENVELVEEDLEFLLRLVETSALVKAFADRTGRSVEEVEELWDKAKEIVKKEYNKSEDDPDFCRLVVGVLKKMLGIGEG